jgi:hypothetical protein
MEQEVEPGREPAIPRWRWWKVLAAYLFLGPLSGAVIFSLAVAIPGMFPGAYVVGAIQVAYMFLLFFALLFAFMGGGITAFCAGLTHIALARTSMRRWAQHLFIAAVALVVQTAVLTLTSRAPGINASAALFGPMAAFTAGVLSALIAWRERVHFARATGH